MKAPTPRPYQVETLDSLDRDYFDRSLNRLLVKSPTGTGKTVTFAKLLTWKRLATLVAGKAKGAKMLVVAHRKELLTQAQSKIQAANPGMMVAIEQGELVASRYADVIVASIQTLSATKFKRLHRLIAQHGVFPIVVIDEAHHAAAGTYRTMLAILSFLPKAAETESGEIEAATHDDVVAMEAALKGWDAAAPRDRLLVGVTATPNRTDAIGLGCVFQTISFAYPLRQAIADGYLVPPIPWVVETAASLEGIKLQHGDFNQRQLAEAVNNLQRNQLAVKAWQDYARGSSTLAFTVDVAHAHDLAATFRAANVRAEALSGETPADDRARILRQYEAGQIDVIPNCMVLTEGYDSPRTGCILHAKPTQSSTLYEQMTGRGLRPLPDDPVGPDRLVAIAAGRVMTKADCIVIDLVDLSKRHSLQAAPVLYGLPPGIKTEGEDLGKLAEDLEALREKGFDLEAALRGGLLSLEQLRVQASTFDIWTVPELGDLAKSVTMNWIRSGETFRIGYPWTDGTGREGTETLTVQPDVLGHFDVSLTFREKSETPPTRRPPGGYQTYVRGQEVRQRTIAAQVPTLVEALRLAETFISSDRRGVNRLKDRSAPWREGPASDKQLAALRRMRIPHDPTKVTKGRASDLLDLAMARRRG